MVRLALLAAVSGLLALLPGAPAPPTVHPVSVPRLAVVGTPWRASVRVTPPAPAVLEARSAGTTLRARLGHGSRRDVSGLAPLPARGPGRWPRSSVAAARGSGRSRSTSRATRSCATR